MAASITTQGLLQEEGQDRLEMAVMAITEATLAAVNILVVFYQILLKKKRNIVFHEKEMKSVMVEDVYVRQYLPWYGP